MGKSLLEVLTEVATSPEKQAVFDDNPARYLAQYGYEDVDADALSEAFSLVADTLPPDVARSVAGAAGATTPLDVDDGSGGAPDTAIHADEDAFGGVDESFDTAALNGAADDGMTDDGDGADADDGIGDDIAGVPDADDAADGVDDGDGGFGTGELSLGDLADDGLDADGLDAGDTVAFGVGSEGAGGNGADAALADDLDDGGTPFLDSDAEAFALDDAGGDTGLADDAFDDAPDLGEPDPAVDDVDDVDDGAVDDPSFDDIGSF